MTNQEIIWGTAYQQAAKNCYDITHKAAGGGGIPGRPRNPGDPGPEGTINQMEKLKEVQQVNQLEKSVQKNKLR
ncbi:MAG TPA: hypothetical protein VF865_05195 [Acidobacteriaceae bacterium]